jgi:glyoxylase-like metal-dependent hydrolase (beta-lactamase superfamily II)
MFHAHAAEEIHRVEEAHTNWYLVQEGRHVTVVDTGFPRSWASLLDALDRLGRTPADVEAVVLTHGHYDHVGFAERAHRELDVPVWVHERDAPLTRHPWRFDHERPIVRYLKNPPFLKVFAEMGAKGALWVKGVTQVSTYGSSGSLDVPGRPEIVFTPGHTHGHCALHFPDRGAVIAGDAFVMYDPYTGRRGPCLVAGAATADSRKDANTLERLAQTGAQIALTGHGEPWTRGVREAVDRAVAAGSA